MPLTRRSLVLAAAAAACRKPDYGREDLLPDIGQLPEFALERHDGGKFSRADLRGRVWILDFIFTRCTAVCPRMSAQMRDLQQRFAAQPRVGLLSISIDPDHDTARVLAEYAARHQAQPGRWIFLTGAKETIRNMQVRAQRHLDPDEITAHSKQFYLLDGEGFIRGVYSLSQPGGSEDLAADLEKLLRNAARPQPGVS